MIKFEDSKFWDMTLCYWKSIFLCFEGLYCPYWTAWPWSVRLPQKVRVAWTTTKCHISKDMSHNQYCSENFEPCKTKLAFYRSVHDIKYISLLPCQEIHLQQHWQTHRRWFPSTLESASPSLLQPTAWYHNRTKFAPQSSGKR